ncbi:MAG: hypothetical protein IPM77_06915 [Crocinitomicaceae bacterium]|nr:hypothetical protein [Crocinitomicaceae bacterium]
MTELKKTKRICENGHTFFKSSNCPVCPVCEKDKPAGSDLLNLFSAPARRALESAHISKVSDLSKFSEHEILSLHGFGKSGMTILKKVMSENNVSFKNKKN